MEALVLQHIKIENPGYIKDLMLADGWKLKTVELDEGEKIPDNLDQFDAMLCMGGPMDTWMEKKYPWLIDEKQKIKEFVIELEKPFLGFCLGCQLLGEVVGGKVVKSNVPEIGMMDVNFSQEAKLDNIELAQLASAELYFLLNDYNLAIQFAKKSRLLFEKDSPNDIRAQDIIYFSNEKLRILQEEE